MRALIIFSLMLLGFSALAQEQTAPAPTAPAEPLPSVQADEMPAPKEPIKTGFLLSPTITMTSRKLDMTEQSLGKMRETQINTKAGYVFDFGLFAGAQLNYALGSYSTAGATSDQDTTAYSVGPTVGYSDVHTGLFVAATYHVAGRSDIGTGKYEKVMGYQIDLGYPMTINENVKLGPQLTLKRIDLEDGTNGIPDNKIKELTPYFGLWLYF
jgi:hypothetical protein